MVAVVITWEGQDPSLPSIILNSHIDVVPVFPVSFKLTYSTNQSKIIKVTSVDIIFNRASDSASQFFIPFQLQIKTTEYFR